MYFLRWPFICVFPTHQKPSLLNHSCLFPQSLLNQTLISAWFKHSMRIKGILCTIAKILDVSILLCLVFLRDNLKEIGLRRRNPFIQFSRSLSLFSFPFSDTFKYMNKRASLLSCLQYRLFLFLLLFGLVLCEMFAVSALKKTFHQVTRDKNLNFIHICSTDFCSTVCAEYVHASFHHLWMAHLIATFQSSLPFDCLLPVPCLYTDRFPVHWNEAISYWFSFFSRLPASGIFNSPPKTFKRQQIV